MLAKSYLQLLEAQPGRPLAMFAPRRVGKTYFLGHDLAPAARNAKWLPVDAGFWPASARLPGPRPTVAMARAATERLRRAGLVAKSRKKRPPAAPQ